MKDLQLRIQKLYAILFHYIIMFWIVSVSITCFNLLYKNMYKYLLMIFIIIYLFLQILYLYEFSITFSFYYLVQRKMWLK